MQHLYRSTDFFEDHKAEIEKSIYIKMAYLMNADVDLIFYDTTSLHFEIDEADEVDMPSHGRSYEALRKRGHSSNGREDAPQIEVGLAVTREGLPVRSWVFPGNTTDVTTVEKVKEDNRKKLSLRNGKYILGAKMRANDEVTGEVLARPGRYKEVKDNLRVKTVIVGDGERRRRYVIGHNPDEETRQRKHREKVLEKLGRRARNSPAEARRRAYDSRA